jgi:HEAT repeat protein
MSKSLFLVESLTVLAITLGGSPLHAAEMAQDPDERLLQEAGINIDDASLLGFLADRLQVDPQHIGQLIRQLGDTSFQKREQAAQKLVALGSGAVLLLRQAITDPDPEIGRRAQVCLEEIPRDTRSILVPNMVGLLVRRRVAGTVEVLLRYLPSAEDDETQEEIWFGLDALAVSEGKAHPALIAALHDSSSLRRAAAACILGRQGHAIERAAVRKLLADPDSAVRLRAAQGLLAAKESAALAVLVALLDDPSTEVSWQAEELLHWVAGDDAPEPTIGAGTPESRQRCQAAWRAWSRQKGPKVDFAKLEQDHRRPGLILVRDSISAGDKRTHRVWLCGCDGRPRWEMTISRSIADVHVLPRNRILLAEVDDKPTFCRVTERALQGKILWQEYVTSRVVNCQRLPNGNTFIAAEGCLMETAPDGQMTYYHELDPASLRLVSATKRGTGPIRCVFKGRSRDWPAVVTTVDGVSGWKKGRPVRFQEDIDPRDDVRPIPRGQLLVRDSRLVPLRITDTTGRTLRRIAMPHSVDAVAPLHNGNLLVLYKTDTMRVIELDRRGKTVWEALRPSDWRAWPMDVNVCLPLVRLGFDGPRPTDWDLSTSVPYWLKRLHNKNAYVRATSTRALAELGPAAEAAIPLLIDALDDPAEEVAYAAQCALTEIGPKALPALARALKDKRVNVRASAAYSIGGRWSRESRTFLPDLIDALRDPEPRVRWCACAALGSFESEAAMAVPALTDALNDKDARISGIAATTLGRIGPKAHPAVPTLTELLRRKNKDLAIDAASGLGGIGPAAKAAVPALIEALHDNQYDDCRSPFICALGAIGPEANAAVPSLVAVLKAKDVNMQHSSAVEALGKIGPHAKEAVPLLIRALKNKDDYSLRIQAAAALGRIGPDAKDAITTLLDLRREDGSPDKELNRTVEQALLRIRGNAAPSTGKHK